MRRGPILAVAALALASVAAASAAKPQKPPSTSTPRLPTWYAKYQHLLEQEPVGPAVQTSVSVGANVDVSNEDGPQSETSIAIDPSAPAHLVAGSNDVDRLPERAFYSSDGGASWGGVDLPLPPPATTNGTRFGTDPGLAFDTQGNVYYSYIVVFFNRSMKAIQGSEMAVAKSTDGGQTWPQVTYFNFISGNGPFNDKPMIAVDTNAGSPYKDTVYVAWDTDTFGNSSKNNVVLFSKSTDGGQTFNAPTVISPQRGGPQAPFAADPFVGANGDVYVAYQDNLQSALKVVRSTDGGATWGSPVTIAQTRAAFDVLIPAAATRTPIVYPACGADLSSGSSRGRLYCSWMDATAANGTDIFVARSSNNGASWSSPVRVNDDATGVVHDQFFQWLSVDPVSGGVAVSFYDTRNDPQNTRTDVYFAWGDGASFDANTKVTDAMSDETSPCANARDQYGDYEGIAAYDGVAHPVWTDSRPSVICDAGEEVFTAAIEP
jgi:hypothetical protein